MPRSPINTAWLIAVITGMALLSGMLFQRRVWCRYLCPVGRFSGVMSSCATLELRANTNLCANDCRYYLCYVGEEPIPGCPVYSGPFALNTNHDCILCGNCFKICPHLSPRLNLRLPGHELWSFLRADKAVQLLIPVILATQFFRTWAGRADSSGILAELPFGLGSLLVLALFSALVFMFIRTMARLVFPGAARTGVTGSDLFSYTLVPLVFASELCHRMKDFLREAGQLLPVAGRQLGLFAENLGLRIGITEVHFLQVCLILAGVLLALLLQKKLSSRFDTSPQPFFLVRAAPLLVVALLLILSGI